MTPEEAIRLVRVRGTAFWNLSEYLGLSSARLYRTKIDPFKDDHIILSGENTKTITEAILSAAGIREGTDRRSRLEMAFLRNLEARQADGETDRYIPLNLPPGGITQAVERAHAYGFQVMHLGVRTSNSWWARLFHSRRNTEVGGKPGFNDALTDYGEGPTALDAVNSAMSRRYDRKTGVVITQEPPVFTETQERRLMQAFAQMVDGRGGPKRR
jgi:hypothetical protein